MSLSNLQINTDKKFTVAILVKGVQSVLTGADTLTFFLLTNKCDAESAAVIESDGVIAAGVADFHITAAELDIDAGQYFWKLKYTDASGEVSKPDSSSITVEC